MTAVVADETFPTIRSIIGLLESTSISKRPPYLGGELGLSSSIAVSMDLQNSSHYDVNDASVGVVAFAETKIGCATNWYFVFPNVLIRYQNKTYSGLCIKLRHGRMILFDGRVLRHCTSVHSVTDSNEHTLGWFWAASKKAIVQSVNTSSDT